jgi:hypothetical protein
MRTPISASPKSCNREASVGHATASNVDRPDRFDAFSFADATDKASLTASAAPAGSSTWLPPVRLSAHPGISQGPGYEAARTASIK